MTDEELKQLFDRIDSRFDETHRHFDVLAEGLDAKIDLVVESVAALDEKVDRRIDDLEQRMERGFAETQTMLSSRRSEGSVCGGRHDAPGCVPPVHTASSLRSE